MNKNLKKVISAVAALAISASSIAAFAVNFPDVEETASYAQAVQELSALGVISGFDDGTFKPDELVTRAQISKMIVDALAEGKQAEASSNSSKFADVSDHWATGYINQGVTDGWIAGYSDTEFGPDDNVTYVQAQKMLVAATGYDIYATAQGGWPAGYKLYASSLDITSGVQGVTSDDQQLTRAQVAQMIDNAMDAPLCVIDRWEPNAWGTANNPILDVKDGEGKDYQTLFTEKHDAYKVYGRVTDTNKSNENVDVDKVKFRVEKADNFDGKYITSANVAEDEQGEDMYIGDSKADEQLKVYSQALVQKNDDDEYTIISITPAAANKTVSLLAEDVDDSKSLKDNNALYFYPTGTTRGSVKYELADNAKLYVNGKDMGDFTEQSYEDYIYDTENDKARGTNIVTLQKVTNVGSTTAKTTYDIVMITTYGTAVVEQVIDKADKTTISFKHYSDDMGMSGKMVLDKESEDKKYTFTFNGEEIDPAELQEYDVLTISYDVTNFTDSSFYEVQVSRDTAEGKYTGMSSDKYVIGGEKYKAASGMGWDLESSTDYTLYLDVYGRIAYTSDIASSKKIGILKNVYPKNNGDWIAEVITKEGTIEEFTLDEENGEAYHALLKTGTDKVDNYRQQVIEYKVSGNNKLTIKNNGKALTEDQTCLDKTYKASTEKLGSINISDATTIIDISNVGNKKDDFKIVSKDSLKDGAAYTAYGFDKSSSNGVCSFVVITVGKSGLDSKTELAVFVESGSDTDNEGTELDTMTVIVNGEKQTLFVDDDPKSEIDVTDYSEGDPIIFTTNASGNIDEVLPVFATEAADLGTKGFTGFKDLAVANSSTILNTTTVGKIEDIDDGDEDNVSVKFGAVVREKKSNTGYVLANVNDGVVDFNDDTNIDLNISNAKIYTYNFANKKSDASRLVIDDGMAFTSKTSSAYTESDTENTYNLNAIDEEDIVFAVVRTFDDDEAQEIYLILKD